MNWLKMNRAVWEIKSLESCRYCKKWTGGGKCGDLGCDIEEIIEFQSRAYPQFERIVEFKNGHISVTRKSIK